MDKGLALKFAYIDKDWNYDEGAGLDWRDTDPEPTEAEITTAWNDYLTDLSANQYRVDRVSGNAPVYEPIGNAGDVLQRLINALEEASIAGLTIPQECLDYRDACEAVKSAHPKPA